MPLFGLFGPPDVEKLKAKGDVEGLIKALNYEKDVSVRRAAAGALGGWVGGRLVIQDLRVVEALEMVTLKDENDNVRQAAAMALLEALKIHTVRSKAAGALVNMGKVAVEPLLMVFKDRSGAHEIAKQALIKIGDAAIEPMMATLKKDSQVSSAAIEVLGQIGRAAVGSLVALLKDENVWQRRQVVETLGKIKDTRAVEPLIKTLEDKDSWVRKRAVEALKQIGDTRAVVPLLRVLKDEDRDIRMTTAEALRQMGDVRAIEPLVATFKEGDYEMQKVVAKALDSLGWQPLEDKQRAAIAILNGRWEQAANLGAIAVEPLVIALKAEPGVTNIRNALKQLGAAALNSMVMTTKDENPRTREAAVEVIKMLMYDATILASTTPEDLRKVATLSNITKEIVVGSEGCASVGYIHTYGTQEVDLSQLKQLARQELIRRGLEA